MSSNQEKTTIVVVDDSPSIYRILAEKLRDQPYEVVGYQSSNLALEQEATVVSVKAAASVLIRKL